MRMPPLETNPAEDASLADGTLEKEIEEIRERVGEIRQRAHETGDSADLGEQALSELWNALEELRVTGEELTREQQKAARAHHSAERERRRYEDLFQSAPAGYVVTDLEGRILEANHAAVSLLNVPLATLRGTPLEARVRYRDIALWRNLLRPETRGQGPWELFLRRRAHRPFPASVIRSTQIDASGTVTAYRWSFHETTALKEQEERLRQSERLMRSLVDGALDFAILRLDSAGRIASWNEGAHRIFGYSEEEALGRPLRSLRVPGDETLSDKQLLAGADRCGHAEAEGWVARKSGEPLWANVVLTPLQDLSGRLTGFVCVLRDVTDRRRAEQALSERNRLLALQAEIGAALTAGGDLRHLLQACARAIVLHLGSGQVRIWTHDAEATSSLRLRATSGAAARPSSEARRLPLEGHHLVSRVARLRRTLTDKPAPPYETSSETGPRRRARPVWRVGVPLVVGKRLVGVLELESARSLSEAWELGLEASARAISLGLLRLEAETALTTSVDELEQVMRTMPDAVFTLDDKGCLLMWNQKLEHATGWTREELAGRSFLTLVPETEAGKAKAGLAEARRQGGAEWEGCITRADGTAAPTSWALARRQSSGKFVGWTGSGRDVSERRDAERRLAQLSRSLLHLREEEQRRLARELHDSTAQSLAAVCMNLARLRDDAAARNGASIRVVEETQEIAQHCLSEVRTISYLLHPPLLDEVGLPAALRWFVKGFSQRSGIQVKLKLPAVFKRLDPETERTLFRIVQESLSNVHRHSGASTATVTLRRTPKRVLLEVGDDGRGVRAVVRTAPERSTRTRRAAPGKRVGSSRVRVEGMGLGLMGMRERVEDLRGRLEVLTGTKGTTVRVELPIGEGTLHERGNDETRAGREPAHSHR